MLLLHKFFPYWLKFVKKRCHSLTLSCQAFCQRRYCLFMPFLPLSQIRYCLSRHIQCKSGINSMLCSLVFFDRDGAVCICPIWIKLLLLNYHLAQKHATNDSRMMVSTWNAQKLGLPFPLSKSNINRGNSPKSQWYKYKCKSYLCLVILIFHFLLSIWIQQLYYCQLSEICGKEEVVGIK